METDLEPGPALVVGDRVQLQQLVLNLLLNGLEAMDQVPDRPKKLCIRSRRHSPETVLVEIRDYGVGLENPERSSKPSSPRKRTAWAWDWRSAARSSKRIMAGFGPHLARNMAHIFCFTLPARPVGDKYELQHPDCLYRG